MANNYTFGARNTMVSALPGTLYMTVHSADPGQNGSNEVPGVTRQPVTLNVAANGARDVAEAFVDVEVATGNTVSYVGVFTALTGGTFISSVDVQDVVFNQDSVYRISDIVFDLNLTCAP